MSTIFSKLLFNDEQHYQSLNKNLWNLEFHFCQIKIRMYDCWVNLILDIIN